MMELDLKLTDEAIDDANNNEDAIDQELSLRFIADAATAKAAWLIHDMLKEEFGMMSVRRPDHFLEPILEAQGIQKPSEAP